MVNIASGVNIGTGIYMGVEKTPIFPSFATQTWQDIAWDGNQTVLAVGYAGYGATSVYNIYSTNVGLDWNTSTIPVVGGNTQTNFTVTYGNGTWVALGGAYGYYSTDGVNWTQVTGLPSTQGWNTVRYGNGLFIAVANRTTSSAPTNVYATSTNGITWTSRTLPSSKVGWYGLIWGNGTWVLNTFGPQGSTANVYVYTSTDGIAWTSQGQPVGYYANRGIYANGQYIIPSGNGKLNYSADGVTWYSSTVTTSGKDLRDIAYSNGVYVTTAYDQTNATTSNQIFYSSGLASGSWTAVSFPIQWGEICIASASGYQSNPTPGFVLLWDGAAGYPVSGVNVSYNGVDWI